MDNKKNKLFFGNLSWKATDEDLRNACASFGEVISAKVIEEHGGKSKGFGFVEMSTPEEASRVIEALDNQPLLDRNLRVSFAQDRPSRDKGPAYSRSSSRFGN